MAYIPYKTKKFKLRKEAMTWAKKIKKDYAGAKVMKIETNYNNGEPFPYEGVVLMKE